MNLNSRAAIGRTTPKKVEHYSRQFSFGVQFPNKEAKGRKGAIVAMIKGTVAEDIITVLKKTPERLRKRVQEVTMDMAANMRQ